MGENKSELGKFTVVCADSRKYMRSIQEGLIDSVITDPPYLGFGFTRENYMEMLKPFLHEIQRCVGEGGRIAISQPQFRLKLLTQLLGTGIVVRVVDAYADRRGDDAYFLTKNAISDRQFSVGQWQKLPGSTHPNPRDVNKMAALVEVMSEPGDTILDPFCGSGAIGLAAVLLGRNYVGIELDETRALDAKRRFLKLGITGSSSLTGDTGIH